MTSELVGRWWIVATEMWDQDAIDLVGPANISFGSDGCGCFRMIAVEGDIDARFVEREGGPAVEFRWVGADDLDAASGRAWAVLEADGSLRGRIFFHGGDDSSSTPCASKNDELDDRQTAGFESDAMSRADASAWVRRRGRVRRCRETRSGDGLRRPTCMKST